MKVLILKPRLDVTFKQGQVPKHRGSIAPIRVHWENFVNKKFKNHQILGDQVTVIEKPLWKFSNHIVEEYDCDLVYIPHKEHHNFPIHGLQYPRYYMQTVFPWLFTVNGHGWGAGMNVRVGDITIPHGPHYKELKAWADANNSKFNQPKSDPLTEKGYIFFPCQIPHDETIKHHSKVSVSEALKITAEWCKENGKTLIVKGHPVNPGSMAPLREIANKYDCVKWRDSYSVHDLIKNCEAVFCVNSGVGMEALIHLKPVFHFGEAEYSQAAIKVKNGNIQEAWDLPRYSEYHMKNWLETWVDFCYDTR